MLVQLTRVGILTSSSGYLPWFPSVPRLQVSSKGGIYSRIQTVTRSSVREDEEEDDDDEQSWMFADEDEYHDDDEDDEDDEDEEGDDEEED